MYKYIFITTYILLGHSNPSISKTASATPSPVKFIQYDQLTHQVSIEKLRAGSHDPSGENEYYFEFQLKGKHLVKHEKNILDDLSENQKNKNIEQEKQEVKEEKIETDKKNFGTINLKSLTEWQIESKKTVSLKVTGDQIRELVNSIMLQFKTKEHEVEITGEVSIFEKNKKFYFWGENTHIGSVSYKILPTPSRISADKDSLILKKSDDKGFFIEFSVKKASQNKLR